MVAGYHGMTLGVSADETQGKGIPRQASSRRERGRQVGDVR